MEQSKYEHSILQVMVDAEMLDRARRDHEGYVPTTGRRVRVSHLRRLLDLKVAT